MQTKNIKMSSTGYGPKNAKLMKLLFDGDDTKYELWEARFLGYLQTLKLKETIVPSDNEPDEAKNEECYAELIQLLDDKSLSLVKDQKITSKDENQDNLVLTVFLHQSP